MLETDANEPRKQMNNGLALEKSISQRPDKHYRYD